MKTAVIIARFQTPYLHQGHKELIDRVKGHHNKLVIVLGVSPIKGSRRNPFDYFTREQMIKKAYPDVVILPLADHPDDNEWSNNLDKLLKSIFPDENFCLYGSRDSFIPYYTGKLETLEMPEHGDYNATELRRQYADKVFDSDDFRAGILYAYYNQYTKVYPTVDIAVFKNDRTALLLGKKSIVNNWRLVGGFADPQDPDFETAALRELHEECGQLQVSNMVYETSRRIDDWRYRNETDKIITLLFSCDYIAGELTAQDDIAELRWFKLTEVTDMIKNNSVSPEHREMLSLLITKYLKP